jgi:hypothetical protein
LGHGVRDMDFEWKRSQEQRPTMRAI